MRNEATLLCTKALGLFSTELFFYIRDISGTAHFAYADESWAAPLGVRTAVLELSGDGRALVSLPNGQGAIVVHASQLREVRGGK